MARMRDMAFHDGQKMVQELEAIPGKVNAILDRKKELQELAGKYLYAKNFLFPGDGASIILWLWKGLSN